MSGPKGVLWGVPGEVRVTQMLTDGPVPKWNPRVPQLEVLGTRRGPKDTIVDPFVLQFTGCLPSGKQRAGGRGGKALKIIYYRY